MSNVSYEEVVARLDKLSEMVHTILEHVTKRTPTQEALELRDLIRSLPKYSACTVYPARQGATPIGKQDGRPLYKIETAVPANQVQPGVYLLSGFYREGAIRASADYIRKWVEEQRQVASAPVDKVEARQEAEEHCDDLDPTF